MPFYAHAEARKAPGLDGKVERDADGKEVRYPVILSHKEKMIARRVVLAFGQTVCGFDLLRANGRSYVCDVNGFSFVKTSLKYYEVLFSRSFLNRTLGYGQDPGKYDNPSAGLHHGPDPLQPSQHHPSHFGPRTRRWVLCLLFYFSTFVDDPPLVSTPSGKLMELRCVIAVIRHG